jgi:formate dehydrogenase major subunit
MPVSGITAVEAVRKAGVQAGERVSLRSRRGSITLLVREDDGIADGSVFVPFAYAEAAANLLTNPALDPFGKIPELKYCAVQVARA